MYTQQNKSKKNCIDTVGQQQQEQQQHSRMNMNKQKKIRSATSFSTFFYLPFYSVAFLVLYFSFIVLCVYNLVADLTKNRRQRQVILR